MILAFVKGGWLRSITFTALLTTHLVSCEVPQPVSTTLSAPILTPKVIVSSPSDPTISTQCLASDSSGVMWFTSGSVGTSYLIKRSSIVKENGEIFKWERWPLEGYFAEGCVSLGQQILILTWQSREVLVFDKISHSISHKIPIFTEGWGLARTAHGLVYSDGSSTLRWVEYEQESLQFTPNFSVTREAVVRADGKPVYQLNELEVFDELILANIYPRDLIAVISPEKAEVIAWLDLSSLRNVTTSSARELNGIAYHPTTDSLWVTGKDWSHLYSLDVTWLRDTLAHLKDE